MSALARMLAMSAAIGVVLPMPMARRTEGYERTDADREALDAAERKRARKAAKRLAAQCMSATGNEQKGKER